MKRSPGGERCGARLHRERCEVEACRPAFRALGQVGELARIELDTCSSQQQSSFRLVEAEVRHLDLVDVPASSPACKRQSRLLPACNRDQRAGRDVLDELREHVQAGRIGKEVQIVEHEHQGMLERGQRPADARDTLLPRGCPWAGQRLEHLGRDRLDSMNRGCDVSEEHHGVAVSRVEQHPCERTRISLGPAREKGRLAVPDRRNHSRERNVRSTKT